MSDQADKRPAREHLLTREQIEAMTPTDKVHFLNPNGRRLNRSLGDATGIKGFGVHLIDVPPGADSTEYHVHFDEDECVYVIAGHGEVLLDGERFEVAEGDFIGLPAGGPAHLLHNPGPGTLRCLVVGQRLAHDVADYPFKKKRIFRHQGGWELVDHANIVRPRSAPGSTVGKK